MNMLWDFDGMGRQNLDLKLVSTIINVADQVFCGQMNKIFIVNTNWMGRMLWSAAKPFIPATAIDRISVFSPEHTLGSLQEFMDDEHLPSEWGGKGPPIEPLYAAGPQINNDD